MKTAISSTAMLGLVLSGGLFGFFYAWVCSTMWGLDMADPRVAIAAMQAMNASVRNAVFAPVFFGTPVVLSVVCLLAWFQGARRAAVFFALAVIFTGPLAVLLTMQVHVPMNEKLASVEVPSGRAAAQAIWDNYSPNWQIWNQIRTVTSGIGLFCAGLGLRALSSR